uniref:OTU domain-containing protein n=1 Tax=Globisporangium ultimum (strain ATCC 200006 / CBS 805.95 / DAOM BR144) TaxID=431595 RepID=K3WW02_GLOUD
MLRYEETKPLEKQALAAVKKRARMKFRWGSSSGSSSNNNSTSHSVPSSSTSKISSSKVTKESTVRAHSSPEFASSLATTSAKTSVGSSKRPSYRLRLRPRQLPSIIESELEDQEDSDDEDDGSNTSTVSTSSSASSSISLPATSAYAFESPESSLTSTATTTSSCSSLPESTHNDKVKELSEKTMAPFLPRVEYNLRKLLRQVMGLDGLWSYDQQVERHYARIHWTIKHTVADGNCLFRAISDQLYGHEMFHGDIRRRIVDFMQREGALFQPFLATTEATAETIEQYCRRMKREGEWGGNPELYAAAKLFNIHIIVHQSACH